MVPYANQSTHPKRHLDGLAVLAQPLVMSRQIQTHTKYITICSDKYTSNNRPYICIPCMQFGPTTATQSHQSPPYAITTELNRLCSASYVSCKCGTARICCCAPCSSHTLLRRRPCCNRSISPTRQTHSSKPTTCYCSGQM